MSSPSVGWQSFVGPGRRRIILLGRRVGFDRRETGGGLGTSPVLDDACRMPRAG